MEALIAALRAALPGLPVEAGALPVGTPFPAVVVSHLTEAAEISHSGESDLHRNLVQVDCYAATYRAAETLFRQAATVLQPPLAFLEIARRSRESGANEATRPYRVSADYLIFNAIS